MDVEQRSQQAQSLLSNDIFKEAFASVQEDIVADIANIKMLNNPEGGADAVKLAMELQQLEQVKIKLREYIEDQLIHGEN